MTKINHNALIALFSGKISNLVFRRRGNKTTAYILSPRKTPLSEKQKAAQQQFSEAVAMAKQALQKESERQKFKELAKKQKKASAYGAAVSYYYKQIRAGEPIN
ncbi:MAG: hypothetical protein RBS73_10550 [Prolixibacteraceae bacterium]|jgi:hypothetical protein|nr:hypothetical protein [Prolixibacteraceae bacterium]